MEEMRSGQTVRALRAQAAKGNTGVIPRYRPFMLAVGDAACWFEFSRYLANHLGQPCRPMKMRLKDHHLPTLSSRTVSVVFRPPKPLLMASEIREKLKPENLSFTTIAKRVGERWQDIPAEEKEPYESEASAAKEKYHAEMADYKTTKSYREYQQYLAEFKAKHASNSGMYKVS